MKKKNLLILPALALIVLMGASAVSAYGGPGRGIVGVSSTESPEQWNEMMTKKAEILGINLEELKTAWVEGKNFKEIAESKGITQEQMHEKMQIIRSEMMKQRLQNLVVDGKITQAQADARLANMLKNEGKMGGFGQGQGKSGGRQGGQFGTCPFAQE